MNWRKGPKHHQKHRIKKLGDRGQRKSSSRASCPGVQRCACTRGGKWVQGLHEECSLKESSPDQFAVFSNRTVWKEVRIHCPLLRYSVLCQPLNVRSFNSVASKERAVNAIALLVSALIRLQNWPIWFHFLPKIVAFPLRIIQTDCVSWMNESENIDALEWQVDDQLERRIG